MGDSKHTQCGVVRTDDCTCRGCRPDDLPLIDQYFCRCRWNHIYETSTPAGRASDEPEDT